MTVSRAGRYCFYWYLISLPLAAYIEVVLMPPYCVSRAGARIALAVGGSGIIIGLLSPLFVKGKIAERIQVLLLTPLVMLIYAIIWSSLFPLGVLNFCGV